MSSGCVYKFGSFRLNVAEGKLFCDEKPIPLTPKAFETLLILVRRRGQLVEKETLINEIWRDSFVEESSLTRNISTLRKALGENDGNFQYIETLPKRGYSFIAPVQEIAGENSVAEKSIAVLPFKINGGSEEQKYLSIGMADALITRLSRIRQLIVRPTNAIYQYTEDTNFIEIAKKLQVETVLDGRIMQFGERLRVTVQFISVADQRILWSEKFEEKLPDIFDVQDSIAERVSESLLLELTNPGQKRPTEPQTNSREAYHQYLMGRYFWHKRTANDLKNAVESFQCSISADPKFPLAHLGLAECYAIFPQHHLLKPDEAFPLAKAAAEKALKYCDTLAEAYGSLGYINFVYDWNWQAAEENYRKAVSLKPNYATGRQWYGIFLSAMGRFEESLSEIRQAQLLDPQSPIFSQGIATVLYFTRRYEESLAQCRKTLAIDPNFILAHGALGILYRLMGEHQKAVEVLEKANVLAPRDPSLLGCLTQIYAAAGQTSRATELLETMLELFHQNYLSPFDIALVYLELKEYDRVFEWLDKAFEMRDTYMSYLKVYPDFDPVRSDPRFADLLQRLNLV